MNLAGKNDRFAIKDSIRSIVYQLLICKQKTTNLTTFQAGSGKKTLRTTTY